MRKTLAATLAGTAMLITAPAWAQGASTNSQDPQAAAADDIHGGLSDIVVTARRRAEPLQQTPLAVSAIPATRLSETHVSNISDLSTLAPSINLVRNSTNPSSLFMFVRGFGSKSSDPSSEPPVAITIDGIYQAAVIGMFINLFDVEGVEVLRGPQGTLLGKNAPAGGISIRTRRPKNEFNGFVQADYGSYGDFQVKGYVDVPLVSDKLSATVSYFRERSDGYVRNLNSGTKQGGIYAQSIRAALLATPTEDITWYISGQVDIDKGEDQGTRNVSDLTPLTIPTANYITSTPPVTSTCTNANTRALCGTVFPNRQPYTTNSVLLPRRNALNYSITSNLDIDAGAVSLALVSGYRRFHEDNYTNIGGAPINVFLSHFTGTFRQFSQEIRVSSRDGGGLDMDGKLNWLLGAYYFNFNYDRPNDSVVLNNDNPNFQHGNTNSMALFAHAEYNLTDKLGISGGVRQTWDQKTHSSIGAGSVACTNLAVPCFGAAAPAGYRAIDQASWSNLSADATVNYRFTPDKMIFFRFAQGYRGGGFNGIPTSVNNNVSFQPETVNAIEFGSKTDFFDHRLRVNISAFLNKYKNLQRTISVPVAAAPFFAQIPQNIAKATTKGVEVELQARPVDGLTLRGSVGYLDAKYTEFFANLTGVQGNGPSDNTGLVFPYTSKWTSNVGLTYEADLQDKGTLSFIADYQYRSRLNYTDLNYAFAWQKGYGLLSASVNWVDPSKHITIGAYAKNLTNEHYLDGGDAIGGISTFVTDGPPRTFGGFVSYKF